MRPSVASPVSLDAVIGLGSNLGDRRATLQSAARAVAALGTLLGASPTYESRAVGPPQPDYLNAAVRLRAVIEPPALLELLLGIERDHGRERRERWGPRTLDLDLLWIDALAVRTARLVVPHPCLLERPFALRPLLDVAPDARDPASGERYADRLATLGEAGLRRHSPPLVGA
ncbi:MAG: 2-amino-4-hydroxy-6-hydroxymethyldihydropteridine diphosphokinase [Polyangiaceae bacterium]|nr:2-amino-4-hydroxy-6-hydroxymethyldihydropteridine diphosphokinase [Polyangiaceae bacterium]